MDQQLLIYLIWSVVASGTVLATILSMRRSEQVRNQVDLDAHRMRSKIDDLLLRITELENNLSLERSRSRILDRQVKTFLALIQAENTGSFSKQVNEVIKLLEVDLPGSALD